jgi:hypothetical protein
MLRHRDNPPPIRYSWEDEEGDYEDRPVVDGDTPQRS